MRIQIRVDVLNDCSPYAHVCLHSLVQIIMRWASLTEQQRVFTELLVFAAVSFPVTNLCSANRGGGCADGSDRKLKASQSKLAQQEPETGCKQPLFCTAQVGDTSPVPQWASLTGYGTGQAKPTIQEPEIGCKPSLRFCTARLGDTLALSPCGPV